MVDWLYSKTSAVLVAWGFKSLHRYQTPCRVYLSDIPFRGKEKSKCVERQTGYTQNIVPSGV